MRVCLSNLSCWIGLCASSACQLGRGTSSRHRWGVDPGAVCSRRSPHTNDFGSGRQSADNGVEASVLVPIKGFLQWALGTYPDIQRARLEFDRAGRRRDEP